MSEKVYTVVPAGGVGSRMRSDIPKQFMDINDRPMISYVLRAFEESRVDGIIIAVSDEYRELLEKIIKEHDISKFICFVQNGSERVYSVKNGLEKTSDEDIVLIHDAARPMVTPELINSCIDSVKKYEACIAAVPVKDTIKEVSDGAITDTPDRSRLFAAQTPQCFRVKVLRDAYGKWEEEGKIFIPTDDASLVERYSDIPVRIIEGDEKNIKVTTPGDIKVAESILKENDSINM